METGGVAGYVALALFVVREIFNAINHVRVRSKCGEKEIKASLDIDKGGESQSPV